MIMTKETPKLNIPGPSLQKWNLIVNEYYTVQIRYMMMFIRLYVIPWFDWYWLSAQQILSGINATLWNQHMPLDLTYQNR